MYIVHWFLTFGSIERQGFGESVSGVSVVWFTPLVCALIHYIVIYMCLEFEEEKKAPTTKGSMNAGMELVGFSTSNALMNRWLLYIAPFSSAMHFIVSF